MLACQVIKKNKEKKSYKAAADKMRLKTIKIKGIYELSSGEQQKEQPYEI